MNGAGGFLDALAKLVEIEVASAFMDLNGIAAAHRDVRLRLALQIAEIATDTSAALRIFCDADGLEAARPNVARNQAAMEGFGFSGEKLRRFGSLDRGNDACGAVQDTSGVAGFLESQAAGPAFRFEEAGEAGSFAGADRERDAITGNSGGVNPGNAERDGRIIHKEARFEVVGSIENHIEASEQIASILRIQIGDDGLDGEIRMYGPEAALGGDGFWQRVARVGLLEERLPLQIRCFDEIAVDNSEPADSGADEQIR